jgi:hypothetical protein
VELEEIAHSTPSLQRYQEKGPPRLETRQGGRWQAF